MSASFSRLDCTLDQLFRSRSSSSDWSRSRSRRSSRSRRMVRRFLSEEEREVANFVQPIMFTNPKVITISLISIKNLLWRLSAQR